MDTSLNEPLEEQPSERRCPRCKVELPAEAEACPECGIRVAKRSQFPWLAVLVVIAGLVVLVVVGVLATRVTEPAVRPIKELTKPALGA